MGAGIQILEQIRRMGSNEANSYGMIMERGVRNEKENLFNYDWWNNC